MPPQLLAAVPQGVEPQGQRAPRVLASPPRLGCDPPPRLPPADQGERLRASHHFLCAPRGPGQDLRAAALVPRGRPDGRSPRRTPPRLPPPPPPPPAPAPVPP